MWRLLNKSGVARTLRPAAPEALAASTAEADIAAGDPAELLQTLLQRGEVGLPNLIVLGEPHDHANTAHPIVRLRGRRYRPRGRRATEQRDELAPSQVDHEGPQTNLV
jgi:hypothetical protein